VSDVWLGMMGDNPPKIGEIEHVEAPAAWIDELAWRYYVEGVKRWEARARANPLLDLSASYPEPQMGLISTFYGVPLVVGKRDEVIVYRKKRPMPVSTDWRWATEGEVSG
jgi:hypothetical protein